MARPFPNAIDGTRKLTVNPRAVSCQGRRAPTGGWFGRILVLLVAAAAIAGCAGGPKLSVSQAEGPDGWWLSDVRRKLGGSDKSKGQRDGQAEPSGRVVPAGKARVHALAQQMTDPDTPRFDRTAESRTNWTDRALPTFRSRRPVHQSPSQDPFLAADEPKTGSAANFPSATQSDAAASGRTASGKSFEPAGGHQPEVDRVAERRDDLSRETENGSAADDNPFAEFENARATQSGSRQQTAAATSNHNTFVGGFDSKLDRLRRTSEKSGPSTTESRTTTAQRTGTKQDERSVGADIAASSNSGCDPDLLRRLIAGSDVKPQKKAAREFLEPEPDNIGRTTGETQDRTAQSDFPPLPEWARTGQAEKRPQPGPASLPLAPQRELPSTPSASTRVAERKADPSSPDDADDRPDEFAAKDASLAVTPSSPDSTVQRSLPEPTAADVIIQPGEPTSEIAASRQTSLEANPAGRVDLLPAPAEPEHEFASMIVESDALPTGFAEWHDDGERAAVWTNTSAGAEVDNSVSAVDAWARLAVNSRPGAVPSRDNESFVDIGSRYPEGSMTSASQRTVRNPLPLDAAAGTNPQDSPGAAVGSAEPGSQNPVLQPRRELFTEEAGHRPQVAPVAETTLESVNWGAETGPRTETSSPGSRSRAIVGLLIGLSCLIGFIVYRRIHARGWGIRL